MDEVLVVGAGPTGLTAAIELARQGVKTAIIDQRPGISPLARAVGITPASLALLKPSGATEQLLQQGQPLTGIRIHAGNLSLPVDFSVSKVPAEYAYILSLPQEQTETILTGILAQLGISVRYDTTLMTIKDTHEGALVTCSDGTTEQYRYVVGADGINSTTRQSSGLKFGGFDLDERWSVADVEASGWPHNNTFNLLLHNNGAMAAIVPLTISRVRVIANVANALELVPAELNITHVHRQDSFAIAVRQVNTYQRGNLFLAGDAAHCHSPVGGRGMNLGIADAACLARCIARNNITAYSAERHPIGAKTIANSERLRKLLSSTQPLMRGVLRSSLRLTQRSATLQRRLVDQLLYS